MSILFSCNSFLCFCLEVEYANQRAPIEMIVNITEKIRMISPAIDADTSLIPQLIICNDKLFSMQMKLIFYEAKINTSTTNKPQLFWFIASLVPVLVTKSIQTKLTIPRV